MCDALITTRGLAELLAISVREAYRVGGRCPRYVVGRQLRYRPSEVLEHLRREPEGVMVKRETAARTDSGYAESMLGAGVVTT